MSQAVAHLLGEFHPLTPEVLSRKSRSWGCAQAEARACRCRRPCVRFLSGATVACAASSVLPAHLGTASTHLSRGRGRPAGLAFSRAARRLALLCQLAEVAHAARSHVVGVEVEAQRQVGVGGPQVLADHVVARALHLGGIILTKLGAHG